MPAYAWHSLGPVRPQRPAPERANWLPRSHKLWRVSQLPRTSHGAASLERNVMPAGAAAPSPRLMAALQVNPSGTMAWRRIT